ncbi:MAG: hypothetical protein WC869_04710 [Phycisphaerae bacterium]|jgi:hypothetical protein
MPASGRQNTDLSPQDCDVLRRLACELAQVAQQGVHKDKARLWTALNALDPTRPLVLIDQIPWHEMNVGDELDLQCTGPWARQHEQSLRRTLYQWRHMPADMVVPEYVSCPLAITNTGYGLAEDVDVVRTDPASSVVSRHFHRQIIEPADIEKIQMPRVSLDPAATDARFHRMQEVYAGILPVRKEGIKHIWYTPWDELIRWWGVEEAMMDLVLRPEMVHEAVARCAASMNSGLDQMEKLNLLSLGNDHTIIGSGGYGFSSQLPAEGFDPRHVRPIDNWGCSNAQIFSQVSPEMHWDFALRHDIPWLSRWGLNYYGCCEPLHHKVDILRRIPRLRKISMSPWIDVDKAVEAVGADFVFSCKPNPAILAEDTWRPRQARAELRAVLEKARPCRVEIILKDISTVRCQPQRLWQWQEMAMELAEQFAP